MADRIRAKSALAAHPFNSFLRPYQREANLAVEELIRHRKRKLLLRPVRPAHADCLRENRLTQPASLLAAMVAREEEQAGLPERLAAMRLRPDGRSMLRAMLDAIAAVEPKVYPYSRLVYAARIEDPVAAGLWKSRMESRRAGMGAIFDRLAREGRLREGITAAEAADIAWAVCSPHHYEYLVVERGWSMKRYRAHMERTISVRLLAGRPSRTRSS